MVAWSEGDSVDFLIDSKRDFGQRVGNSGRRAFVDGPYGGFRDLASFDKVLIVAGGIGIAPYLMLVRELLGAHQEKEARVRRVDLVWLLESKPQLDMVQKYLVKLCQKNEEGRQILNMIVFTEDEVCREVIERTSAEYKGIKRAPKQELYCGTVIQSVWDAEAGNMVISGSSSIMGTKTKIKN